jgi:UDP-glucose 4-epimerase
LDIGAIPDTAPADIPWYVSDNTEVETHTGWKPKRNLQTLIEDTLTWLIREERALEHFF